MQKVVDGGSPRGRQTSAGHPRSARPKQDSGPDGTVRHTPPGAGKVPVASARDQPVRRWVLKNATVRSHASFAAAES